MKITTHQATVCGLLLALTLVLSLLPLYRMPYGGTITLGGMLPMMLIAFVYGPRVGIMAGFVYGLLNLLLNPYILHPVQVLLDYPLPFMALGLCGFFPQRPYLGMASGICSISFPGWCSLPAMRQPPCPRQSIPWWPTVPICCRIW